MTVQITGYHACENRGKLRNIERRAPFLSGGGEDQWLTQGYYFWTDSDRFAHFWGKFHYDDDYVILKCNLEIEKILLLDLIGSVEAQIYFYEELFARFRQKVKEADPEKEPTMNTLINFFRLENREKEGIFPFVAIKAQDHYAHEFISFSEGSAKMCITIQRQQLCLFDGHMDLVKRKKLVYPEVS